MGSRLNRTDDVGQSDRRATLPLVEPAGPRPSSAARTVSGDARIRGREVGLVVAGERRAGNGVIRVRSISVTRAETLVARPRCPAPAGSIGSRAVYCAGSNRRSPRGGAATRRCRCRPLRARRPRPGASARCRSAHGGRRRCRPEAGRRCRGASWPRCAAPCSPPRPPRRRRPPRRAQPVAASSTRRSSSAGFGASPGSRRRRAATAAISGVVPSSMTNRGSAPPSARARMTPGSAKCAASQKAVAPTTSCWST